MNNDAHKNINDAEYMQIFEKIIDKNIKPTGSKKFDRVKLKHHKIIENNSEKKFEETPFFEEKISLKELPDKNKEQLSKKMLGADITAQLNKNFKKI